MEGKFSIDEIIEKCTFCLLIFNVPRLKLWNDVYNFLERHYKKPVYVRNVLLSDKKYNVAVVQYANENWVDQAVVSIDNHNYGGHILKTMKLHKNIRLVTDEEVRQLSNTVQITTDFENINESRRSGYKRKNNHKPVECPSPEPEQANYKQPRYRVHSAEMTQMLNLIESTQKMLNGESNMYPTPQNFPYENYQHQYNFNQKTPVLHHTLPDINKCVVIENLPKEATCGDVMLFLAHDSVPICGCAFDSRLSVRERKTAYVTFDQHYKALDCILHFNGQIFMNEMVLVGLHPGAFLYELLFKNYKVASSSQITKEIISKISQVPADLFAPIPLSVSVYTGALEQIYVNPNVPVVRPKYYPPQYAQMAAMNNMTATKNAKSQPVQKEEELQLDEGNDGGATPIYEMNENSMQVDLSNCSCVMVTNLPEKATEHTLREHFSDFYDPVHIGVEQNGEGVPIKAYLYYESYETVQQIVSIMDGSLFHGKQINTVLL